VSDCFLTFYKILLKTATIFPFPANGLKMMYFTKNITSLLEYRCVESLALLKLNEMNTIELRWPKMELLLFSLVVVDGM